MSKKDRGQPAGQGATVIEPLIGRLLVGINALEGAIPRQPAADYAYFYQELKAEKRSSLAQLTAAVRAEGIQEDSDPRALELLARGQASVSQALSTLLALRALRVAEAELVNACADALERLPAASLRARAVQGALGRAVVGATLLTAHVAKLSGKASDAAMLPRSPGSYFAGEEPRVCMRCLLDRPGRRGPLERRDPHPYTYICSACHDEVHDEFPVDLLGELDRAEEKVRHARIIHRALGRPSRLMAMKQPIHELSGIAPEIPVPALEQASDVPEAIDVAGPQDEPEGVFDVPTPQSSPLERDYVELLFDYRSPRRHW